jgi:hypothetical protein
MSCYRRYRLAGWQGWVVARVVDDLDGTGGSNGSTIDPHPTPLTGVTPVAQVDEEATCLVPTVAGDTDTHEVITLASYEPAMAGTSRPGVGGSLPPTYVERTVISAFTRLRCRQTFRWDRLFRSTSLGSYQMLPDGGNRWS